MDFIKLINGSRLYNFHSHTEFCDGHATMESPYNPNGSSFAIEGIISPCGQILGKMGHSERYRDGLLKNVPGNKRQNLFRNAVNYFRKKN